MLITLSAVYVSIIWIPTASCEANGGKWGVWRDGPETYPECNMPTLDAGKACTDSSQCESYCQAPKGVKIGAEVTGQCYDFHIASCMQEVRNGLARHPICE